MGFLTVTVDAHDLTGPKAPLSLIQSNMESILRGAGHYAYRLIRRWVADIGQTRHGTATRLGATPTNHYKGSDVAPPVVFDNEVSIAINTPGISRAFGDLHIRPVEARALAIPMHRDAYGLQPRELTDRGEQLFRILRRGEHRGSEPTNILYRRDPNGGLEAMYALVGAVNQPQDRTLLPPDDQLSAQFAKGAKKAIKAVLQMQSAGVV